MCFFRHFLNCKEIILQAEGWCLIWKRCLDGDICEFFIFCSPKEDYINSKYGYHQVFFFFQMSSNFSFYHYHSWDCSCKFQICVPISNQIDFIYKMYILYIIYSYKIIYSLYYIYHISYILCISWLILWNWLTGKEQRSNFAMKPLMW